MNATFWGVVQRAFVEKLSEKNNPTAAAFFSKKSIVIPSIWFLVPILFSFLKRCQQIKNSFTIF